LIEPGVYLMDSLVRLTDPLLGERVYAFRQLLIETGRFRIRPVETLLVLP